MRLNLRSILAEARYYLRLYWWWMTSGSLLRFAIGYGVPIALLIVSVQLVRGGDDLAGDTSALSAKPGVTAEVAGAAASPQATSQATASTPLTTPTVGRSVLTYVVKSGDSLGAICSAQVPTMAVNACVTAIVELNKLGGPDKLSVGQSLSLPAAGASSSSASQPPASSATAQSVSNASAAVTSTPRPGGTTVPASQTAGKVTIDTLSSPLKPGQTANLNATVAANASCAMSYAAPNGSPTSSSVGQIARAADAGGKISWTWEIAKDTKKGKGLVVITCAGTSISAYIEIN